MSSVTRGTGRAAMVQAAADCLLEGREVKVLDVAEAAGVGHTLIYRHFPDGGRDELVAEAYAQLFRGQVAEDLEVLGNLSADADERWQQINQQYRSLLSPARDRIRWARLEAIAKARSNPYIAERLEAAREELIDLAVDVLTAIDTWHLDVERTRAFATVMLAVPLGTTPMLGPEASTRERHAVADLWTDILMNWLVADEPSVTRQSQE